MISTLPSIFHSSIDDGNQSFLYGDTQQVIQNRESFLQKHRLSLDDAVVLRTEHQTKIQRVDSSWKGRGTRDIQSAVHADALITQDRKVVLFLLTADCLPMIFYDSTTGFAGLAHVSRENTSHAFCQKIIDTFVSQLGAKLADIQVYIGPSIHKESYVKDLSTLESLSQKDLSGWKPFIESIDDRAVKIDMVGYNVQQCRAKGVEAKNISVHPADTFSAQTYFSHQRSQVNGEKEGRFATVVVLE